MCLICETQKAERVTRCWFISSSVVTKLAWGVWDLVSLRFFSHTEVNFTVCLLLRISVPPDKVVLLCTKQSTEQGIQPRCLLSQMSFQNLYAVFLVLAWGIIGVCWEPQRLTLVWFSEQAGAESLDVRPAAQTAGLKRDVKGPKTCASALAGVLQEC